MKPGQPIPEPDHRRHREADPESVEAVILAGGHAWGDNPLEHAMCRTLVPIAGRPLLMHTLDWLRGGGIRRVSICVNHEGRQIRRVVGDGSRLGLEVNYFEDVMPRGPAGCARDVAGESDAARFLVLEGTILPQLALSDLLGATAASVLTVVVTPGRASVGAAERVFEPAGIYVFSRAAFAHVPDTGYQDIKETLIPRLHVNGERVDTFVVDPRSVSGVSGLASYLCVSHQAAEQLSEQSAVPEGYLRVDGALIHRSARMEASVRLVGPVLVGPEAELGEGSIVVGPTTIGARVVIGAQAVVCRCVLWSGCVVEDHAILDQCVVMENSLVRAGREVRHTAVVRARRDTPRQSRLEQRRLADSGQERGSLQFLGSATSVSGGHSMNASEGKEAHAVPGRSAAPRHPAGAQTTEVKA